MRKLGITVFLVLFAYLLVAALAYLGFATYNTNLIGWFLIFSAIGYGLGGPYLFVHNLRQDNILRREEKDLSFWFILPGFLVVYYASPLEYLYFPGVLPLDENVQFVGMGLIVTSVLIMAWAQIALKGKYSGRVWVVAGQTLVQTGPYHFLRHPAYASFLLMGLGISIGYSSLVGLLAIPALMLPGLIYRMFIEEKVLKAQFGQEYVHYAQRTKRIIPGIW